MRFGQLGGCLAVLLLVAGCSSMGFLHTKEPGGVGAIPAETPTPVQLVHYLNRCSEKINVLECSDVTIDGKQGSQGAPTVYGDMVCQKPRNFRLQAKFVSNPAVDIGSNDQELWYWVGKADPHVFHVNYKDLPNVKDMPFPFQPDWVLEALGMATYDENKTYKLGSNATEWLLEEDTTSPQGQPVKKITVFNKGTTRGSTPQVTAHRLYDDKNNLICSATIIEVQQDGATSTVVPRKVVLSWPKEKMELKMTIGEVRVARDIDPKRAETLFQRKGLSNLPSYDLARGADAQNGIQRVGGFQRNP
jgi:hypothetical protein